MSIYLGGDKVSIYGLVEKDKDFELMTDFTLAEDVSVLTVEVPEKYRDVNIVCLNINLNLSQSDWIYPNVNTTIKYSTYFSNKDTTISERCIISKLTNNWYFGGRLFGSTNRSGEFEKISFIPYTATTTILQGSTVKIYGLRSGNLEDI